MAKECNYIIFTSNRLFMCLSFSRIPNNSKNPKNYLEAKCRLQLRNDFITIIFRLTHVVSRFVYKIGRALRPELLTFSFNSHFVRSHKFANKLKISLLLWIWRTAAHHKNPWRVYWPQSVPWSHVRCPRQPFVIFPWCNWCGRVFIVSPKYWIIMFCFVQICKYFQPNIIIPILEENSK